MFLLSLFNSYRISSACIGETNKALFTGGGVKNSFLMNCIQKYSDSKIIIPADEVIEFKEAIIFGLLGYLRIKNKINVLSSVTGASSDSSSGSIVCPWFSNTVLI